jgi:hypothetical protein
MSRAKRSKRRDPMQITEGELRAMTSDLDDLHHETMPQVYEKIAEWTDLHQVQPGGSRFTRPDRRMFLSGTAIVLGGAALAACSSTTTAGSGSPGTAAGGPTTTGARPGTTAAAAGTADDLRISALATALENLAVGTYQAGIDAATAGKLGTVPPAVVTFAQTAQQQHRDHANAWNAVLAKAGQPKVTGVDMTVKTAVVDPAFAKVTDVPGLAQLALQLEDVAAATYLSVIPVLHDKAGIMLTSTIQPVEMQHSAILNFVLGQYPVPRSFASTEGARGLDDQVG